MFVIISKPSETAVSYHSIKDDAEAALAIIETVPATHEIKEIQDGTE